MRSCSCQVSLIACYMGTFHVEIVQVNIWLFFFFFFFFFFFLAALLVLLEL
jgi:hypothetical protein